MITAREVWLTPAVCWFLDKCGATAAVRELTENIRRARQGYDENNGCIRFPAPSFLLIILDPAIAGGPERVLVWHGPSEGGPFYKSALLASARRVAI